VSACTCCAVLWDRSQFADLLSSVSLWNTSLGDVGARRLAKALQSNSTLLVLDLGQNGIDKPGIEAFKATLQSNHTLTTLIGVQGVDGLLQRNAVIFARKQKVFFSVDCSVVFVSFFISPLTAVLFLSFFISPSIAVLFLSPSLFFFAAHHGLICFPNVFSPLVSRFVFVSLPLVTSCAGVTSSSSPVPSRCFDSSGA
jgi:hypothetical protein